MEFHLILGWLYQLDITTKLTIAFAFVFIIYKIHKANAIDTSPEGLLDWKKKRELHLYHATRVQAYFLEIMIVFLGIWTAFSSGKTITVATVFVIVVALAEFAKLVVSEAASRYPSVAMILLCFISLSISATFSGETLYRVSSHINDESTRDISDKQNHIKDNNIEIGDLQERIISAKNDKNGLNDNLKNSSLVKLNQQEIETISQHIKKLELEREESIKDNNKLQKGYLERIISDIEAGIKKIDENILNYKSIYQADLVSLRSAKFQEVENARRGFIKTDIRNNYDTKITKLSEVHALEIYNLTIEKNKLKSELDQEKLRLETMIPLNNLTKEIVIKVEKEIQYQVNKRERLSAHNKELVKKNNNEQDDLIFNINQYQDNIRLLKDNNTDTFKEINELKTKDMFYSMASIFFKKEASDLTEADMKKFLRVFIGVTAVGLSLIPVLLLSISVIIEKRITEEAKEITSKQFVLKVLDTFRSSLKYLSETARSSLAYIKEMRSQRMEKDSKINQVKQKYKALELASSHEKLNERISEISETNEASISKILGSLEHHDTTQKQAIIQSIMPIIKKIVDEKVDEVEINAKTTENFISKSFLSDLLNGSEKKDDRND